MNTECIFPNHFLPPAKICAEDEDNGISSDAFEEQYNMLVLLNNLFKLALSK